VFRTLEIPTTLPTLDELMGRPGFPDEAIARHLLSLLRADRLNVFTLHAEIEGMGRRAIFREFLAACRKAGVEFARLEDEARSLLADRDSVPVCEQEMAPIEGRSGLVASQAPAGAGAA
jgi:undecaprenyl phosphate-alpha-L-ara4FN deformylase